MCTTADLKREIETESGKLVQCTDCWKVGLEFGTTYLTFDPPDFYTFSSWIFSVVEQRDPDFEQPGIKRAREKVYLQLNDPKMLLALNRAELRQLAQLLDRGAQWIQQPPERCTPLPVVSTSVH